MLKSNFNIIKFRAGGKKCVKSLDSLNTKHTEKNGNPIMLSDERSLAQRLRSFQIKIGPEILKSEG